MVSANKEIGVNNAIWSVNNELGVNSAMVMSINNIMWSL